MAYRPLSTIISLSVKNFFIQFVLGLLFFTGAESFGQVYRSTPPKINDLVHTRLDLHFDYGKSYVYGKAWLTLKPHFYPTDTLRLDAKGMDLVNISMVKNGKNIPLKYKYDDSLTVAIQLDKVYNNNESYTIYIDYTAKPNQLKV